MKFKHLILVGAGALCLAAPPAIARSAGPVRHEPEVARCIRQASQGRAWLEKTLWGLRDQEAGWVGAEIANTNGTHDLGVLQINSGWVPRLARLLGRPGDQVRTWLRYDPCFNAEAARWIFLSALHQTGDYWKAVGVYHSPTAWRQRRYALSVASHLRRRFGEGLFAMAGGGTLDDDSEEQ
ncbi:lytic transglycosylase domain-containing protein [Novosphingobium album (ex Liu et al. 2023)]|uniref:Lytic transglycosylase domain-containing protein n=1 Tax=Novosphingobium album (ex Liu et al. 2023) TaxID=3031130 RepID=A0ABT5WQH2_9SPHN|nr:lytic transglycosylase domain-containing protein [Novosphingobium album (ex Liu et al. 2023)]MDE8652124.1 lytic transglycosylase domain-containing protein [Novosphingobium album (ex Liu et al. 2023)]